LSEPSFTPNPLVELTKARVREFVREKGILFWVFAFPLLMAIGLGVAFRDKPAEPPRVAVVGGKKVPELQALLRSKEVRAERMSKAEAARALKRTKVDLIVEWSRGRPVLRYDSMATGAPLARAVTTNVLERAAGRRDLMNVTAKPEKRPGARYVDFLIPGLIAMNLMGTSMWGVGYNLVLARKRRLLRRYAVTPMRRSHFLLSYFVSRSLFLVVELTVLIAFGWLTFGTRVQGSLLLVPVVALLGASAFAAISLIIGARVDNTESANGWMNFVQLPMWVLSGAFFSYERFPEVLHEPIRLLPLTALCDALRVVYAGEASLRSLGHEVVVLVVWSVLGYLIAARTFRWQ
jgi:ABC-type multidrug transport system permease subunit